MNAPKEVIELIKIEEAPLGGGGGVWSLTGAGVGFISTDPAGGDGDSSPEGAGAGVISVEPEGGGEVFVWLLVRLLLSASTIITIFSFLRQLSLMPLMK